MFHTRIKRGWWGWWRGWGELFWKETQRTEPISSSQVVKLKVCDPVMSQGGRPRPLLVCLGKGNGNWARWLARALARRWNSRLGTIGFWWAWGHTCSNSPEEKFPPKRKCGELPRRFSTLPAAGAAVRGLVPLLPAPPGGPRVLPKHTGLPLVVARGHRFPARAPGRAAQSLSTFQSRNPFPFPRLQGQVLTNVPVH